VAPHSQFFDNPLCWDESSILALQKKLIGHARTEIYGSYKVYFEDVFAVLLGGKVNDEYEWYKWNYGTVQVNLPLNDAADIIYFRIFKNANDNIRTLLNRFAASMYNVKGKYYNHSNESDSFSAEDLFNSSKECIGNQCFHSK